MGKKSNYFVGIGLSPFYQDKPILWITINKDYINARSCIKFSSIGNPKMAVRCFCFMSHTFSLPCMARVWHHLSISRLLFHPNLDFIES